MADDFDVLVVGAGMAGSSAAIRLAQGGARVLLLERGEEPGVKNLSGGILWGHDLDRILPRWQEEMPLERPIVSKRFGFLTEKRALSVEYRDEEWGRPPHNAYSVLRAHTDAWLAKKAEEAGATVVTGVPVDKLQIEEGKVRGVVQGGEVVGAPLTIVCDGTNSRTTLGTFLRPRERLDEDTTELGIKELFRLPKETIEDRFGLVGDVGSAQEWVLGFLPKGIMAGGFLYTNKETLSLGIIVNIGSLKGKQIPSHEIIERFKLHSAIAPYLTGAELVEYGAKIIPLGAASAPKRLWGDGILIAGDAAGFVFSNGLVIQGMNYAIRSGLLAAETALDSIKTKDVSSMQLATYGKRLAKNHILTDFQRFRGLDRVKGNPRVYSEYPEMLTGIFHEMMTEIGQPKARGRELLFHATRRSPLGKLRIFRDLWDISREM